MPYQRAHFDNVLKKIYFFLFNLLNFLKINNFVNILQYHQMQYTFFFWIG